MRALTSTLRLFALLLALAPALSRAQPAPPIARASFYEVLSPYGSWVTVSHFGTVWRPHVHVVGADFYPYATGGHWEYTEYGWTWVSDWAWGWVPFHHGRWMFTDDLGWVWVPDDVWAPAWVEWRIGAGFVGWVPLGPPGILVVSSWYAPRWWWVRGPHFHRHDLHRHRIDDRRVEDDAQRQTTLVRAPPQQLPRGPSADQVTAQGGQVEVRVGDLPRRLPPGSVAAERRIAMPSTRPPVRPDQPALRPEERLPPREVRPAPSWRPPPEPPFAQPWQVRPGVPESRPMPPALAPPPATPLPPPAESPEAIKKKQQRGTVPGPMLPPGPARKVPRPP